MISYYALKVAPLAELQVQKILHQREHPALVPVHKVPVVRPRNGRIVKRERPILPSYVFVGFSGVHQIRAERDWINKWAKRPLVFGPVGFSGKPAVLSSSDVAFLMTITSMLEAEAQMPTFVIGQGVKVKRGHAYLKEGQQGQVVEIKGKDGRRVKMLTQMLSSMRVVEIAASALEAA